MNCFVQQGVSVQKGSQIGIKGHHLLRARSKTCISLRRVRRKLVAGELLLTSCKSEHSLQMTPPKERFGDCLNPTGSFWNDRASFPNQYCMTKLNYVPAKLIQLHVIWITSLPWFFSTVRLCETCLLTPGRPPAQPQTSKLSAVQHQIESGFSHDSIGCCGHALRSRTEMFASPQSPAHHTEWTQTVAGISHERFQSRILRLRLQFCSDCLFGDV